MSFDEALIILSDGNAEEKLRIARACGDMVRAQIEAMQIARECIKRCRDFLEIREAPGSRMHSGNGEKEKNKRRME